MSWNQQAVSVANNTNNTIAKLGESSVEIGKVVKGITSIAEQMNLLALNATIEAARPRGQWSPNALIRELSVVGFIPSFIAAPSLP